MTTAPSLADVRMGGTWTPWQRAKNAVLRALIRTLLGLAASIPISPSLWIGRAAGLFAWLILPRHARLAERRLQRYLPSVDARTTARRCFINAGENLVLCSSLRRRSVRARDLVDVPEASWAALRDALAEGRGVVFVSAHLGPFEAIPAVVSELGVTPSIVVRESYDPRLDSILDAHRTRRGAEVIHRGHPLAPARMLRALRAGRPLGLLPDLGARVPSCWTPFLADRALLPMGPARLAVRAASPVVIGTLEPTARVGRTPRYRLRIERLQTAGTVESLHEAIARALAARIASDPEQWLWMGAKSLAIADDDRGELDSWAISRSRWT